jgi:hypothetical protein
VNSSVTSGLYLLPKALQSTVQTWFILKCTGLLIETEDKYHALSITSDDGSKMFIDGVLVINNDGLHAATTVSNVHYVTSGVHTVELDFFQAGGMQQLTVTDNGSLTLVDGVTSAWYH